MPARGYSVTPNKKRPAAAPTAHREREAQRQLKAQVEAARSNVRQGRGPKADTGNVLRGSTVAPGEKRRAERARQSQQRRKLPADVQTSGLNVSLGDAASALGKVGGLLGRGGADLINLPKNAAVGLYETGAALSEAAQSGRSGLAPVFEAVLPGKGSTARGNKLLKGLDDGALGRLLLHGDVKGAAKIANEHPLYAALEVTGTGQILGRGAGAAARRGVAGRAAKTRASSRRAPLRVEGTNQRKERRYSPNLIVQEGQRAVERGKAKRGLDPTVARGRQRERLLNQEVDEFAAQAEGIRRRGREETTRASARMAPVRRGDAQGGRAARAVAMGDRARARSVEAASLPGVHARAERDVVLAAVEGRLRGPKTFAPDLKRERDRLQRVYLAERHKMSASTRRANREQVASLDRVLGDPKALANAGEVFRAADEYNKVAGKIEAKLIEKGALKPDQADAARYRTYAIAHLGLRPREGGGVETPDGTPVSTEQIKAALQARGDREPGFVGQRRDQSSNSAFFVNWFGGRKTADAKRRTGEAARTGGYNAKYAALEEQLVRGQGVVDAIQTFDDFVGRMGTRRRDGTPFTWDESQRAAGELAEATGMDWMAVRAVPARYDDATREGVLENQGTAATPGHLQSLTLGRLDDSLLEPTSKSERQARNVVLVPAQQVKRFRDHQTSGSSTGAKAGQAVTRAFRGTVLPFSTKWITGNVVEAALRSAVNGIGPGDVLRGKRVMSELAKLDAEAYRQADTRIRGGLLYGSGDRLGVRRSSEDFEGSVLATPAKAAEYVARLPVIRQTLGGLRAYQRGVFALNKGLEQAFQTGVIGKQARIDAQELTGSWGKAIRMQEDVAREVARGLLGTPKQVQFARAADEILGKYSRFSPSTRRAIQTFAPFLPWFLNAARFVAHTLPAKHPVKTALLANVEQTLDDEIKANAKKVPPGELQTAIRRKDGGLVNLARYTPFGVVTKGVAGTFDPLLPQIDSVVAVTQGRSFTGRPLQFEDKSKPDEQDAKRAWLALYTLAEAALPGVAIIRRVREGGATGYDDSTVFSPKTKPGTRRTGAADRILNPIRPTYLKGGAGSGGSGVSDPGIRDAQRAIRDAQKAAGASDAVRDAQRALRDATR